MLQMKVRAELEREQNEIMALQDRDYKQLQKNAQKYKTKLELQQQQEQHQRWAQLTAERIIMQHWSERFAHCGRVAAERFGSL
jgi:hypothetical protein